MRIKPIYIRYRDLVDMGACEEREQFKARFGNQPVLVTVTTAVANAHWVNWGWLTATMLSEDVRDELNDKLGIDFCTCEGCDPDGGKRRMQARMFAEAFLAQGGRRFPR